MKMHLFGGCVLKRGRVECNREKSNDRPTNKVVLQRQEP